MSEKRIRRIAIVGSGASGLFSAVSLRERGFDGTISVFESQPKVGGVTANYVQQDGVRTDATNKLVDSSSLACGTAPDPDYASVLKKYGATFLPGRGARFYDFDSGTEVPFFRCITDADREDVLDQVDRTVRMLKRCLSYGTDPASIIRAGVARAGETLTEFCHRTQTPIVGALISQKAAVVTFTAGDELEDATRQLTHLLSFPSTLFWAFAAVQPSAAEIAAMDPVFGEIAAHVQAGGAPPNLMALEGAGFQGVFDRIAENECTEVRTDCAVESLQFDKEKRRWHVETAETAGSGKSMMFDAVVVATPPAKAIELLSKDNPLTPLLKAVRQPTRARVAAASLVESGPLRDIMTDSRCYGAVLSPAPTPQVDRSYGLFRDPTSGSGEVLVPMMTMKHEGTFRDGGQPEDVVQREGEKMAAGLRSMNSEIALEVRHVFDYDFPYYPDTETGPSDWYARLEAAQGVNGLFYISSLNAGLTMPNSLRYARKLAQKIVQTEEVSLTV